MKVIAMKPNVGSMDRMIRISAGIVLIALSLYFSSWIPAAPGVVMLATGYTRRCPLYLPFHISTEKG